MKESFYGWRLLSLPKYAVSKKAECHAELVSASDSAFCFFVSMFNFVEGFAVLVVWWMMAQRHKADFVLQTHCLTVWQAVRLVFRKTVRLLASSPFSLLTNCQLSIIHC